MKILLFVILFLVAFVILYSFNMIMNALGLFIPINIFSITTIGLLGFPGLFIIVGLITLL